MTFLSSNSHHPLSTSITTNPAELDPLLSSPPLLKSPTSPTSSSPEPPSYSDAIFNPLQSNTSWNSNVVGIPNENSEQLSTSSGLRSSNSEYLIITVSNPQKEADNSNFIIPGGNTFYTYLITSSTNLTGYGGSQFSVRRRFKDVVALSNQLSEAYRGFFVPPRPDKSLIESQIMQKQEFVEHRRVALEKYLLRLAAHQVIRKSDELRVFLQVQGKLPFPPTIDLASRMLDGAVKLPKQLFGDSESVTGPQEAVLPAKGGRNLLRIFKELKQSVINDWGGSRQLVEEEDKEFIGKKERLHEVEQHLKIASQQADSVVKAQQKMGETTGELGLAFIRLTKFENEEADLNTQRKRASDLKNMSTAAVKASRFYRGLSVQTAKHLDTLHEYMSLMPAVHSAFSACSSALLTVNTLTSELASLQSRTEKHETALSKTFGGDNSRIRKVEELKEASRVSDDAKNCAIREYERIKENNRSEIERLDRERKADFVNMLKGFLFNQVAYAEKISNEWAKVADETSGYVKEIARNA